MSELQPVSVLIGFVVAIATTLLGRYLWRYLERALDGSAKLIWFTPFSKRLSISDEDYEMLMRMCLDAGKTDEKWRTGSEFRDLQDRMRQNFRLTELVILNTGKAAADDVNVLLTEKPCEIIVPSHASAEVKETADGKTRVNVGRLEPSQEVRISLIGVDPYNVKAVRFSGGAGKEYLGTSIWPSQYARETKAKSSNRLWLLIQIMCVLFIVALWIERTH